MPGPWSDGMAGLPSRAGERCAVEQCHRTMTTCHQGRARNASDLRPPQAAQPDGYAGCVGHGLVARYTGLHTAPSCPGQGGGKGVFDAEGGRAGQLDGDIDECCPHIHGPRRVPTTPVAGRWVCGQELASGRPAGRRGSLAAELPGRNRRRVGPQAAPAGACFVLKRENASDLRPP